MLIDAVDRFLTRRAIRKRIGGPLMEQALSHTDATAWVVSDDETALECLSFLRARGVTVPRNISVAGFDNIPEASFRGLTTCDFNGAGAIRTMLAYIADSRLWWRSRNRKAPLEIGGYVVDRATVARAGGFPDFGRMHSAKLPVIDSR